MTDVNECLECKKQTDELYITDCTEGFGPGQYCADCLIKMAKEGFNDENTVCQCGCKMQLMDEENILETVNKDGVFCYMCEECEDTGFVGLYVNQPDELVDQVWEGKVEEDEFEYEYVYDWEYATEYHSGNSRLYQKKYIDYWGDL